MSEKIQKESFADKLNASLAKSSKAIVAVVAAIIVILLAVIVVSNVKASSAKKGLEQIETITYALTKEAEIPAEDENTELSEEEKAAKEAETEAKKAEDKHARQTTALEQLSSLSSKSGIVGVRANMLIADIKFDQKKYDEARDAYVKAANGEKAYTRSLNNFNAGVCSEELGDNDSAEKYYKAASDDSDFVLIDHALFSLGRVYESKSDFENAKSTYEKLNDLHPTTSWGQLAKSRLIALKADGKIQ